MAAFQNDLYTLMTSDSSLNTAMQGRIYFENIEENYDLNNDYIVYSFRKTSQQDCLNSRNLFTNYSIYVRILSKSTITINSLSDYIQNFLNGQSYGNIQDVWFLNDNHTMDLQMGQYSILLEFGAIYF